MPSVSSGERTATGIGLVQSVSDGESTTYFCFNPDADAVKRTRELLDDHKPLATRLFLLDAIIIKVSLSRWADMIMSMQRDLIDFVRCLDPNVLQ